LFKLRFLNVLNKSNGLRSYK